LGSKIIANRIGIHSQQALTKESLILVGDVYFGNLTLQIFLETLNVSRGIMTGITGNTGML
jgi:hypothetical protein